MMFRKLALFTVSLLTLAVSANATTYHFNSLTGEDDASAVFNLYKGEIGDKTNAVRFYTNSVHYILEVNESAGEATLRVNGVGNLVEDLDIVLATDVILRSEFTFTGLSFRDGAIDDYSDFFAAKNSTAEGWVRLIGPEGPAAAEQREDTRVFFESIGKKANFAGSNKPFADELSDVGAFSMGSWMSEHFGSNDALARALKMWFISEGDIYSRGLLSGYQFTGAGGDFHAVASSRSAVPEPTTMTLLGAALLGLGRAKKKKSS